MNEHSLSIVHIKADVVGKEILKDVSLEILPREVHALMGPNGSGKSTLSNVIMGHPSYQITGKSSRIYIDGIDIHEIEPHERAKKGLFLAFQSPISVPGVSVMNLLKTSYSQIHTMDMTLVEFLKKIKADAKLLKIDDSFLTRGIHDGFSGGEKKKIEMLQALVLRPKYAIFDEIDTGLDVDALRLVAKGIGILKERGTGVLIVTHYQRILKYLKPDVVHILVKGKIVKTGKANLAKEIEDNGYESFTNLG